MSPFGTFLAIVGGSFIQVLVPCVVAYYFYRKGALFSSIVTLLWVGESIVNVGVYAYDAKDMVLPLVGGENTIHDWNYLLTSIGLTEHAHGVGVFIKLVGFLVLFFASYLAYMYFPSQGTEKKKDGMGTLQEDNSLGDNETITVEGRYPFV